VTTSPPASPSQTKPRILVVDDVLQNLQVVGTMLRNEGYDVMPAGSGPQALERVRVRLPDLILLDLMMPEMDGLEVCRRLKTDPAAQRIPIIFLTASNEMEHLVKGFEAGAVDYVTKPFNGPELLARVRTHLELKLARNVCADERRKTSSWASPRTTCSPLSAIKGYAEMVMEDAQALNISSWRITAAASATPRSAWWRWCKIFSMPTALSAEK
jgi:CheY-like chemotaxis protein